MDTSIEIPNNFITVVNDFTKDLSVTFPEYSNLWQHLTSSMDDKDIKDLYLYCMKIYPERFFDILYQNEDIFNNDSEINTFFLPNVDFKKLYNSEGVTDSIRKTIWKYLQLLLFTIVNGVTDKSSFGDSMNMFEGIDEKELQDKLGETMSGLTDFFKNMDNSNSDSESNEKQSSMPFNMEGMPDMENMKEHLNTLFNGKIGSLAKEMAEEISGEFSDIIGETDDNANPQDVIKKLMKNPAKIMGLMKKVGGKLDSKMKSGEISKEELMKEAGDLLGKMKNSAGGAELNEMISKLAKGMGGLGKNMKIDTNAIDRMTKSATMKEDMKKRMNAKREKELEKARIQAAIVQKQIEEQEKLAAKFSLESSDKSSQFIFKLDGASAQERSYIHPDIMKYIEGDDAEVEEKVKKTTKKKKKKTKK